MKHFSTFLFFFFLTSISAQEINQNDSIQRFRIAVGTDAWNTFRLIRGRDVGAPVNIEAQYFVNKNLSFGTSFGFSSQKITENFLNSDSSANVYYSGRSLNTEYLIRGNYFFSFPNAEGKFLQNWRIYTALGLGLGVVKDKLEIVEPNQSSPDKIIQRDYYFAKQVSVGMEYKFNKNFGFYLETGFAMSSLQIGVIYKF